MYTLTHHEKSLSIVYDRSVIESPRVDYFDIVYWRAEKALEKHAPGRGNAWFINAPFGAVVLRQYFRGGWAAKVSEKSYLFTTVSRSRPFREFHLLATLHSSGLPVPRPVAAICEHRGFVSSGSLMTAQISDARTLADTLPQDASSPTSPAVQWMNVGKCIREFHNIGVWHADLNARNILLDTKSQVYLVDFDRARYTPGKAVNGNNNLSRLKRSLLKMWPAKQLPALDTAWQQLMLAYHG